MSLSVLVTGATGIAGAHVVDALTASGARAVPVSREPRDGWATADLRDAAQVARLPSFDAVVHCAALTPRSGVRDRVAYDEANVGSTSVLAAEAARRRVQRFVFVSTMGKPEQQDDLPGRLYISSKREAERRLLESSAGRFPVWILRAASLYGEYDRGSMATLIGAVARGRFVALGDLQHRKCLLYAGSLAQLIVSEVGLTAGEVLNEAAHDLQVHRFVDVLSAVERAVGRTSPRIPIPDRVVQAGLRVSRGAAGVIGARGLSRLINAAAVALRDVPCDGQSAIGRLAATVDLPDGVRREFAWLKAHGRI